VWGRHAFRATQLVQTPVQTTIRRHEPTIQPYHCLFVVLAATEGERKLNMHFGVDIFMISSTQHVWHASYCCLESATFSRPPSRPQKAYMKNGDIFMAFEHFLNILYRPNFEGDCIEGVTLFACSVIDPF